MTERLRLLTARDAAELVGPSTETIVRRYRAGEIPGSAWRARCFGSIALRWRLGSRGAGSLSARACTSDLTVLIPHGEYAVSTGPARRFGLSPQPTNARSARGEELQGERITIAGPDS